MYEKHFGLTEKPFELSSASDVLFMGASHKRVLDALWQGISDGGGLYVIAGPVGTGKTTLIHALDQGVADVASFFVISNPVLSLADFLSYWGQELGIVFEGNYDAFFDNLNDLLGECWKLGQKVLLVVDEAHCLPTEIFVALGELKQRAAASAPGVLTVLFSGQPELHVRLQEIPLQPVMASCSLQCDLQPLTDRETVQYIFFRLNRAGARSGGLFSEDALQLIHVATGGCPRQINILCDTCLLYAYAEGMVEVDANLVRRCVEQIRLDSDKDTVYALPPERLRRRSRYVVVGMASVGCVVLLLLAYAYREWWWAKIGSYLQNVLS